MTPQIHYIQCEDPFDGQRSNLRDHTSGLSNHTYSAPGVSHPGTEQLEFCSSSPSKVWSVYMCVRVSGQLKESETSRERNIDIQSKIILK